MRFRLTDQLTAAEEFSAASAAEFRVRVAAADSRLREKIGSKRVYLHIATDGGVWIPPGYPHSNAPLEFSAWGMSGDEMEGVYRLCEFANRAGTQADYEFKNISKWAAEETNDRP